ncbi:hypothetical protein BSKO_01995 [Bryopsis sp. KO-2023]|nr:hypothetical protein BSKO_01995 [Bryopsis sp. KO-2023]
MDLGTFQPPKTLGNILCCLCGVPIQPNPSNMCVNCITSQVDVTEGIQKEVTILYCRTCGRYLQPPKHWLVAELESRELLGYCIKRIKGLQKAKLVDAEFIWTEPHSKRIKLRLTVQREFNGAIVEGSFVVQFVVNYNMCPDCARANTNQEAWTAVVQVRQHVEHKKTFFFLEQLILKHKAHENTINVKEMHQGVDFYYKNRAHAVKFIDFLQSVVPIKHRSDRQLVSHDVKSNTYNHKHTFSVEIAPLCKGDLICLPKSVATHYGGFGPVVLCTRVTNAVMLMDVVTLRSVHLDASTYYRYNFRPIMLNRQLSSFIVLDIETLGEVNGRFALAEATIAREVDFGVNDHIYVVRTHLGNVLKPGDSALGYDLKHAHIANDDYDAHLARGMQLPDAILVSKSYAEKRKKRRQRGVQRPWKLQTMDREMGEGGRNPEVEDKEMEQFLDEVEEDPDVRARISVFKDSSVDVNQPMRNEDEMSEDDSDAEELDIPFNELLDDLSKVAMG